MSDPFEAFKKATVIGPIRAPVDRMLDTGPLDSPAAKGDFGPLMQLLIKKRIEDAKKYPDKGESPFKGIKEFIASKLWNHND